MELISSTSRTRVDRLPLVRTRSNTCMEKIGRARENKFVNRVKIIRVSKCRPVMYRRTAMIICKPLDGKRPCTISDLVRVPGGEVHLLKAVRGGGDKGITGVCA